MSVVINDFEILPEPPEGAEGAEQTPPPSPSALTPRDVESILKRYDRRRDRVRAH